MPRRRIAKCRPGLELLEEKRLLSAGASPAQLASPGDGSRAQLRHPAEAPEAPATSSEMLADRAVPTRHRGPVRDGNLIPQVSAPDPVRSLATKPDHGFLVYRLTNPNQFNNHLTPPFGHVLVQDRQPVPGQVYNVLYVIVRNGTAQTFDASSGFEVRFPGQRTSFPILKEGEQWRPGEWVIFYVLTKKYYPVPNVVSSGFQFNLGGAFSTAIPGPSGIFLRLKYNPARINRTLDWIVTNSPGVPGGAKGIKLGLPDTAINEFVSAKTDRRDFGGYF